MATSRERRPHPNGGVLDVVSALATIAVLFAGMALFAGLAAGLFGVLVLDAFAGKNEPLVGVALIAALACAGVAAACWFLIVDGARDRRERLAEARAVRTRARTERARATAVAPSARRAA